MAPDSTSNFILEARVCFVLVLYISFGLLNLYTVRCHHMSFSRRIVLLKEHGYLIKSYMYLYPKKTKTVSVHECKNVNIIFTLFRSYK